MASQTTSKASAAIASQNAGRLSAIQNNMWQRDKRQRYQVSRRNALATEKSWPQGLVVLAVPMTQWEPRDEPKVRRKCAVDPSAAFLKAIISRKNGQGSQERVDRRLENGALLNGLLCAQRETRFNRAAFDYSSGDIFSQRWPVLETVA